MIRLKSDDINCPQCNTKGEKIKEIIRRLSVEFETTFTKCPNCNCSFLTPVDELKFAGNYQKALRNKIKRLEDSITEAGEYND